MNPYEERRQARIERLRERAARKARESTAAYQQSNRLADAIPFGQPILVGHHSEQRDRNYRARIARTMDKSCELSAEATELERRADAAEESAAISSDDPEAVTKLKAKLQGMEARQAMMKAVNAAHRRFLKVPASLDAAELPDAAKEQIRTYKPRYSWEPHPFPPYAFQNLNGNMRRVRERIAELERKAEAPAAAPVEGNGFRIVEDAEDNRIRIKFDSKPVEAVRAVCKRWGFRWSPMACAWQRQLNGSGRHAAQSAAKEFGPLMGQRQMRSIRVTFDDGNSLETSINGTEAEIERYYLGNVDGFQFGDTDAHPADKLARAVQVEFLDGPSGEVQP